MESLGEIIKYPSHELTGAEVLWYIDLTNYITNVMINTSANIEFSKMLYPSISNNYFLMDTGIFTQILFNMLGGSIDATTQITNNSITTNKIFSVNIEKIWNINNSALSYNINTFLNGLGNFIFIDTGWNIFYTPGTIPINTLFFPNDDPNEFLNNDGSFKYVNFNILTGWIALTQIPNTLITYAKLNLSANDIPYNIINIPSSTINFNKMIYPTPTGLFLRDDGTWQAPTAGSIPDNSIGLIKLLTVVGNANNLYVYNSSGVPWAGKLTNDYINNGTIALNKMVNGSPNSVVLYGGSGILTTSLLNKNYFEVSPSLAN